MALSSNQSLIATLGSFFMGFLFAYSASVQLNDPDWYFWFPLYALASGVNLLHGLNYKWRAINQGVVLVLCGGILLLIKVSIEAQVLPGSSGFWCMDMRERVVREKIGSALVVVSMSLHQRTSASGYAVVAALTIGLFLHYYMFVRKELKL